ncbi:MAG: hypothetical protein O7F09_00340 [Chloroflexi bacterium]|nr:hypothetical protein [Chloroflexota bacterium]
MKISPSGADANGKRGGFDVGHAIWQWSRVDGGSYHILGIPSFESSAYKLIVVTPVVLAGIAKVAVAATNPGVDQDLIADLRRRNSRSEGDYFAGTIEPQNVGWWHSA